MGARKTTWLVALLIGAALIASWLLLNGGDQGAISVNAVGPTGTVGFQEHAAQVARPPTSVEQKRRLEAGTPSSSTVQEHSLRPASAVAFAQTSTRIQVIDARSGRGLKAQVRAGTWTAWTRPGDGLLMRKGSIEGTLTARAKGFQEVSIEVEPRTESGLSTVRIEMQAVRQRQIVLVDPTGHGIGGVTLWGIPEFHGGTEVGSIVEQQLGVSDGGGYVDFHGEGAWVVYGESAGWASEPIRLGDLEDRVSVSMALSSTSRLLVLEQGTALPVPGVAVRASFELRGWSATIERVSDVNGYVQLPFREPIVRFFLRSDLWELAVSPSGQERTLTKALREVNRFEVRPIDGIYLALRDQVGATLVGQKGRLYLQSMSGLLKDLRRPQGRLVQGDDLGVFRFAWRDWMEQEGAGIWDYFVGVDGYDITKFSMADASRDRAFPTSVVMEPKSTIRCRLACSLCGFDYEGFVRVVDGDTGERLFAGELPPGGPWLDSLNSTHVVVSANNGDDEVILFDGYPNFQPGVEAVLQLRDLARIEVTDWQPGLLELHWLVKKPRRRGSFTESGDRLFACHLLPGEIHIAHEKQLAQVEREATGADVVTRALVGGEVLVLPNTWNGVRAQVIRGQVKNWTSGLGPLLVEPIYGGPWGVVQGGGEGRYVTEDGEYEVVATGGDASGLVLWSANEGGGLLPIAVASIGDELAITGSFFDLPDSGLEDDIQVIYSIETSTYPFWNLRGKATLYSGPVRDAPKRLFLSGLVTKLTRLLEGGETEVAAPQAGRPILFVPDESEPRSKHMFAPGSLSDF